MNIPEKDPPEPIANLIEHYSNSRFYHDKGLYIGPSGTARFETKFERLRGYIFTWGNASDAESPHHQSAMQHTIIDNADCILYKGPAGKDSNKFEPIAGAEFFTLDRDVVQFVPEVALSILRGKTSIPIFQGSILDPPSLQQDGGSTHAKFQMNDEYYSVVFDSSCVIRKAHRLVVIETEILKYVSQLSHINRIMEQDCKPIEYVEEVIFEYIDFNTQIDMSSVI